MISEKGRYVIARPCTRCGKDMVLGISNDGYLCRRCGGACSREYYDKLIPPHLPSAHPVSDDKIQNEYPKYVADIKSRLLSGADTYGDTSFSMAPEKLVSEIQQEVLDISGWAFMLWDRLNTLKKRMEEAGLDTETK